VLIAGACGGTKGESPKEVTEEYLEAVSRNDFGAAYDLLSEEDKQVMPKEDYIREVSEMVKETDAQPFDYVVEDVEVRGDEATAEVRITDGSESLGTSAGTIFLVREGDKWRVVVSRSHFWNSLNG